VTSVSERILGLPNLEWIGEVGVQPFALAQSVSNGKEALRGEGRKTAEATENRDEPEF
jgi:hypothetical protein